MEHSMEKKDIFRKKSLEKASELEQQNQYLRVTGFGAWVVVISAILLIAAIFLWAMIFKINDSIKGVGSCEDNVLTCYFRQEDMSKIEKGTVVRVNDETYAVDEVLPHLYYINDIPRDILFLSQKTDWYQAVTIPCSLDDGVYQATIELDAITPIYFMRERG